MVLLISYDLNGNERPSAYQNVKETIQKKAISHRKPLYSQWFAETRESPENWLKTLREVIDQNDRLFILPVHRPYNGWLDKEIWEWLDSRV